MVTPMTDGVEGGVTVRAPAKLTVSLRMTGVRADGYHLIDAEMVSLDLADLLTFTEGDGLKVTGPTAAHAGPPADNLVTRALRAVGRRAHVRLEKHIPVGGGLGGGSSDAAAVLRWAGVDDLAVAAGLGADVPFVARTFTLVVPPFGCSTPAVYHQWDALGGPTAAGPNDLEPAALVVEPRLVEWRDRLGEATGETPILAGSGSTWFVPGEHPGEGRIVVHTVGAPA